MTEPVNLKLKMPSGDASDPFAGVETARLSLIDLSDLSSPAGRSRISAEIAAACRDIGFLVLVNHGISNVERQFEIAKEVFELPYEEKEKYNMGTSGKCVSVSLDAAE